MWVSRPASSPGELKAHFRAATDCYGDFGRIVKCRTCGLVYTNPRWTPSDLLAEYTQTEDVDYTEEDASRSINAYLSLNTIRHFAKSGHLLDVGCSMGYFLNAARIHFKPYGVEPSAWAADFAQKNLQLDVFKGTLPEARLPPDHFDVVCLSDVIEHLPDPLATLREVHRITRPGGFLYLVTPDVGSLTAKLMGSHWWGLRPAHIYYFSEPTLTALLDKAGFDVMLIRRYGRVFTMGYWQSRLRHYSRVVNQTLSWSIRKLGIDRKLVYINTMDSIECCARKRL